MDVGERLRELVLRIVDPKYLYYGTFMATAQAPSSGDTVDLLPDDERIKGPGLQAVPISYGIPGVKAKFAPGTRMLLCFENGDPQKPRATLFDGSHVELSFADGVLPFARVSDAVSVTIPPGTDASGGVGQGTIIGGAPTVKG